MSDKLQGGVKAGSTSISIPVILRKTADNTENTGTLAANITAYYWRQGGTPTALTAATDLAAITSVFSAGGWKPADATNAPGTYRLDVDDAAFATGADWVVITVKVASCYLYTQMFNLTTNVVQTGDSFVNVNKLAFTVTNQVDANVLDWKSSAAPAMTGDAFARLGAPAGASTAADIAAVKVDTAAVKVQTDKLTFTVANQVDSNAKSWVGGTIPAVNVTGVPLVDLKYTLGTLSPATAGSVRADSVTGAVGSVTGAVGSVTGAVGSVTGNVGGNVVGSVASVTATVNADIKKLNGTTLNGDGSATPWGP